MVRLLTLYKCRHLALMALFINNCILIGLMGGASPTANASDSNNQTRTYTYTNTQTNTQSHSNTQTVIDTQTCTHNGVLVNCKTREPIPEPGIISRKEACPERIYEPIYGKYCNYRVENLEFIAVKLSHAYGGGGFDGGQGLIQAYAMNDNTDIVGQAMTSSGELHAVWLQVGASFFNDHYFSDFGIEGATSAAHAISNNNTVVGEMQVDLESEFLNVGIAHSQLGTSYALDVVDGFDALGGGQGVALDIARDSRYTDYVVGHGIWAKGENSDGKTHGFLWSFDGRTQSTSVIGEANETNWALAINDSKIAVGYFDDNGEDSAYSWRGGDLVALPDNEGPSRALNINNNRNAIIVGYAVEGSIQHAVYWKNNTITMLPSIDSAQVSAATAATDGLDLVGYSGGSAVLWRDEVVYDLNDLVAGGLSSRLTRAIDMNRQGRILVEAEDGFYLLVSTEEPGISASSLFEVGRTEDDVTGSWYTIDFNRSYQEPIFVAAIETYEGMDTAGLRLRNLDSNKVEIRIEEEASRDTELGHTGEAVGYYVFEEGDIRDVKGNIIGESGVTSGSQPNGSTWTNITLNNSYTDPVVIMQPLSSNGDQPAHVRLRNVENNSFEYQIEEWDYLDQSHIPEDMYYLVVENGSHRISDLNLEAGVVESNDSWSIINYVEGFTDTPVVLSQVQTYNEDQAIVTRQRYVDRAGFEISCQEEEDNDGSHTAESVGYVVIGR